MHDRSELAAPELVLSDRTSEQIDYQAAHEVASVMGFRVALQEIDPRLDVVFAKPGAKVLDGGYWYIVRFNDNAPPSFWKVSDEHDAPCAPDERHLRRMHEIDTTRNGGYQRFERIREQAARAEQKQREEQHREFREKLDERLGHLYGSRIVVPSSVPSVASRESVGTLLNSKGEEITPTPPKEPDAPL